MESRFRGLHKAIVATRPRELRKVRAEGYPWMSGDGFFKVANPDILYKNGVYKLVHYEFGAPQRREAWRGGTYASRLRAGDKRGSAHKGVRRTLKSRLEEISFVDVEPDMPTMGMDTLRQKRDKVLRIRRRDIPAWFRDHRPAL